MVFSGVYGPNGGEDVDWFLEELDNVKACWSLPQCIGGDFNLLRFPSERNGVASFDSKMTKFGDFINRWLLYDFFIDGWLLYDELLKVLGSLGQTSKISPP